MIRPSSFILRFAFFILAGALLHGCQSYTITQQNVFSDDDGNILFLEYGSSDSDHVSTFVAPGTGKELEFRSKLMVRATFREDVPDFLELRKWGTVTNRIELADETFVAWQCMNFLRRGTMYGSDDGEWKLLVRGFSATVYHRTDDKPPRYLEVYRGVICQTADGKAGGSDRWRTLQKKSGFRGNSPYPQRR